MSLTIAPSDEAAQALIERINAGGTGYVLDSAATYSRVLIDPLEQIDGLRVDLVPVTESQPNETFDDSDNSSHAMSVWIRSQLPQDDAATIQALNLIVRQIFLQLNNWDSSDRRVQVWECDLADHEEPLTAAFKQAQLFVAKINLRVEVMR